MQGTISSSVLVSKQPSLAHYQMTHPIAYQRACAMEGKARSFWSPLFAILCRFPKVRKYAIRFVCRLEGGQMWSTTFRSLMQQYYGIQIGSYSYGPCLMPGHAPQGLKVGNYCSFAGNIQFFRRNHPTDRISQHPFFFNSTLKLIDQDSIPAIEDNPLHIGHDVWIGQNVIITPGCQHIGDAAIIASGAVVAMDIPPFAIVGGVPAKIIKWRFSKELQTKWLESKWYLRKISDNAHSMDYFLTSYEGKNMAFDE